MATLDGLKADADGADDGLVGRMDPLLLRALAGEYNAVVKEGEEDWAPSRRRSYS